MASRTTPNPSRIPVPVRSPHTASPTIPSCYAVREVSDNANVVNKHQDAKLYSTGENGVVADTSQSPVTSPPSGKGKGFETFLMTGDMIIRTTPPHQKSRGPEDSPSPSPSLKRKDVCDGSSSSSPRVRTCSAESSPKMTAPKHMTQTVSTENGAKLVAPVPRAPVASFEELSDMSQSSSSGEFMDNPKASSGDSYSPDTPTLTADTSRLDAALETLGKLGSSLPGSETNSADNTLHEPPSSGDSGVLQDSNGSDSDTADNKNADDDSIQRVMTTSMSEEKIVREMSKSDTTNRPLVRTSKSHENYLQSEAGLSLVTIDIDDNMAYSLDTLTYQDSNSDSSNEKVSEVAQQARSLHNSPEKTVTDSAVVGDRDREFLPSFISLQESKPAKLPHKLDYQGQMNGETGSFEQNGGNGSPRYHGIAYSENDTDMMQLSIRSSDDSDSESLYHQPSKGVDQPSAARLAKRLFHLEGFRKSHVSRHLCKKNDFSNLVAEEYLKFFDFRGDSLDAALRKFLHQFCLTGETQERERVLAHFSRHFMECNPGTFNSEDACHTLTCAIMLLNTDLHGQNIGRKMTCADFIENLSELNDGENFQKEVLKSIYQSIKSEPIEWAVDEGTVEGDVQQGEESASGPVQPSTTAGVHLGGGNPFLDVPDPNKTVEYKKGYVMRKSCMEPGKRKTPFGKRGWRMVYTILRDLILYQYKDEHQVKKGQFVESAHNVIRIHHALATKACDYTKKQHVFRLQTADWAEYLFQTGGTTELQEWIDTINLVAATLSSPPLPSGVGSQARFQRPLMPSACTKHSIHEQLRSHDHHITELEQELQLHRAAAPEKGSKSTTISSYIEKENYLEYELQRFKTYSYLLKAKVMSPMELEPSLVETAIGEDDESPSLQGSPVAGSHGAYVGPAGVSMKSSPNRPVQRSLSDRVLHSCQREDLLNEETEDTHL